MKKKVILDTNFLIALVKFKIDLAEINELVEGRYELLTFSPIVSELKRISKRNKFAAIALKLLESRNVKVVNAKGDVDSAILNEADEHTIVATNDKNLRKRLKLKGVKTIYLRAKKKLGIG